MNCYYCDKIKSNDPDYEGSQPSYDLGSGAPRCYKHWRYLCDHCGEPSHFMSTSYDSDSEKFYCWKCAMGQEEVADSLWVWKYYFRYRSPWTGQWIPALDRLEYEKRHPLDQADSKQPALNNISRETYLVRYPEPPGRWRAEPSVTDAEVQVTWNANAEVWDALYDEDGDRNRRYQSDEPMLQLLGEVRGMRILDVDSGNGYLCRKLAKAGAVMTGIELAGKLLEIATRNEAGDNLGITYHHGSAAKMAFLSDTSFDKAVANYVLMDVRDYIGALQHVFRVLRPGGCFVVVLSHPCFAIGPGGWEKPALDSPRLEDRFAWRADEYFHRGPTLAQWGNLNPVMSFHRPLRDYWQAFAEVGFTVDAFEEPSVSERGRREQSIARVEQCLRIPYSCIFQLVKPLHN